MRALVAAGHEAYLVGGCVRDLLLGRAVHDADVATNAHPEQVEACAAAAGWRTVAVGRQFGVIIVVAPGGANVEVATFRHDGAYIDGRRPTTIAFTSAVADVQRRDFSVNALLYDPLQGLVIDHVDGLADLAARRLRAVGDATAR
ncbi:MAG: CCA tRNA nucleotidyltransferase, partial [Planctomycetes bacterium]|nr:CCA tRNA nucleotidyltransferase [Planctomycetota bacterium]